MWFSSSLDSCPFPSTSTALGSMYRCLQLNLIFRIIVKNSFGFLHVAIAYGISLYLIFICIQVHWYYIVVCISWILLGEVEAKSCTAPYIFCIRNIRPHSLYREKRKKTAHWNIVIASSKLLSNVCSFTYQICANQSPLSFCNLTINLKMK